MTKATQIALKPILEIARLAPSVHNTQPWKVRVDDSKVAINLDPEHVLSDGDPTGRETIISLGIFAEAVRLGAEFCGYKVKKNELVDRSVVMRLERQPNKIDNESVALLKNRCSDRSIYSPIDITKHMAKTITNSSPTQGAQIHLLTDKSKIKRIADLTSKGTRVAMSSPRFRKELSQYLILPWSRKKRGIAVKSLHIPWFIAISQPIFVRLGLQLGAEAKLERHRWESASGVVAITTPGDMPKDWFEAGQAYLSVSLAIEKSGLAQATSAATVEASNYHEDVEEMLETSERLQCMLRIGKGSNRKKFSPRVSTETLLST